MPPAADPALARPEPTSEADAGLSGLAATPTARIDGPPPPEAPATLIVAAEFDKFQEVWVFHGPVPEYLIKVVHEKWRLHKGAYKSCLGNMAWKNNKYYYAPYRPNYLKHPTYNWVVIEPRNPNGNRVIILKPQLQIKPKMNSTIKKRKLKMRSSNEKQKRPHAAL